MNTFWTHFNIDSDKPKISISSDTPHVHYTLRFWERQLDIHRTYDKATTKEEKYTTLIQLRYFTLLRLMIYSKDFLPALLYHRIFKSKINLGKLKRNNMVCMELSGDPSELPPFIKVKKKRLGLKPKAIPNDYSFNWISADQLPLSNKHFFMV